MFNHSCTYAHEQGAGPAGFPRAPELDVFAGVLETLAQRCAVVNRSAPDWVQGSIVAVESLGHLWAVVPLPLGRILWAVEQKV